MNEQEYEPQAVIEWKERIAEEVETFVRFLEVIEGRLRAKVVTNPARVAEAATFRQQMWKEVLDFPDEWPEWKRNHVRQVLNRVRAQ